MIRTANPRPPTPAATARGRPLADVVLETIWHEKQLSRADLARSLGLSRSTISDIVGDLLETGLVAEVGDGPSRGGRRPVLLQFQDQAHVILGVDMGASHVAVALTDLRGHVLAWRDEPHRVRDDPEGSRALIIRLGEECLDEWGGDAGALLGIGIGVPSPIDPRHPDKLSDTVLPAWGGESGFRAIGDRFGVPFFADNDANMGALAERWWGAGRGVEHFTYIKTATGIGSGHMIAGQIYRGATSVAGEIGHVSIDPSGPPCICGNNGCLTSYAGGSALVALAEELLPEFPGSLLERGRITLPAIEAAAAQDDPLAVRVVQEAGHYLGLAIAGLLNLLNPGAVIIGGALTRAGERLLVPLRETVLRRTLLSSVAAAEIRMSDLGHQSIALGAATYVLASALAEPSLFPTISG